MEGEEAREPACLSYLGLPSKANEVLKLLCFKHVHTFV